MSFQEQLNELQGKVVDAFRDFFRNDNAVFELRLVHSVVATTNEKK